MNLYQRVMMDMPSIKSEFCPFCGKPATENHHIVPRSQGGLKGPTVSVCGWGNATGCHGMLHKHIIHLRPGKNGWWEWLITPKGTKYDTALKMSGWMAVRRDKGRKNV